MQIDIQSRSFALTQALRNAVQRCLEPLNQRFGERLRRVQVRLTDVNAGRGGVDKQCLIVLQATRRRTVVAQALSPDMYQSIAIAGQRAQAALGSRAQRSKRLHLQP